MTFDEQARAKSNQTQRNMYGGPDGYSAEMKRRQSLRKTHGTGGFRWLKENDPEKLKQIIADRDKKRRQSKVK